MHLLNDAGVTGKFTIGVGCFVALNFWILKVPLIFFHRNQAIKIGMILLSYTFSTRVFVRQNFQ